MKSRRGKREVEGHRQKCVSAQTSAQLIALRARETPLYLHRQREREREGERVIARERGSLALAFVGKQNSTNAAYDRSSWQPSRATSRSTAQLLV